MNDVVDALGSALANREIGQVALHPFNPTLDVREIGAMTGDEIVDNADGETFGKQGFDNVRANESRATGYQYAF
jgi:hypothetical protein